MAELVSWGHRWLREVGVLEIQCVKYANGFGLLVHHLEAEIVIHGWANIVDVPGPEFPGLTFASIGVDE